MNGRAQQRQQPPKRVRVIKDAAGHVLQSGDTSNVIQDLKIHGIDAMGLKSEFVKKA